MHRLYAMALLFVALVASPAFAQQPVQVTTVLRAPYSLQLSDYYASTQEKLVVVLTNRDLNKPMLNVRLRMSIESQTISLRSRDFATSPTLQLEAGVPLRLSLGDLAPYFNPENLDFSGMTRAQYQMSAKLPEGFYQFCFEAIEVSTGQVASAKGCSMAWISLSDPPLLNIPQKGESIALRDPQNIIFQWTPRHLNSPNSAYATEYDFQIVELWDNSLAPEVAFQSMQPLYQTTTRTTTLLYGPSQPLLMAGKRYGWRVRARARSGVEEVDVFRNQGFSEIYWFTYQDMCPAPKGVLDSAGLFGTVKLSWLPDPKHTAYMVTYREKGKEDATWFDQQAPGISTILSDIKPGVEYEYRVAAFCNTDQPVFTDIHTVKAPSDDQATFANCTIVPDAQLKNKEELKTLKVNDEFKANDFPVKITEISGSSPYTGKGYIKIPFLGGLKVGATFENIKVNTDKQLMEGVVITTYNQKEGNVVDIDTAVSKISNYLGIVSKVLSSKVESKPEEIKEISDKAVENAEKELPAEEVQVVKANAKELLEAKKAYDAAKTTNDALPANDPQKKAAEEKIEEARTRFEAAKASFSGIDRNAVTTQGYQVLFKKIRSTLYGFDNQRYYENKAEYERLVRGSGAATYVSWKAVPAGQADWIAVKPDTTTGNWLMPDSVFFGSSIGRVVTKKGSDAKTTELRVFGLGAGQKNEVFAYRKKKVNGREVNIELGKLNIVSYTLKRKRLIVVEVNGNTSPHNQVVLQKELNKLYNPAMIQWNVQIKQFTSNYDLNNDGRMDNNYLPGAAYTAEMRKVLSDYSTQERFAADTHYMFLVGPRATDGKVSGYNPFMRPAGFILMTSFFQSDPLEFVVYVAHELGHGAFDMRHTFQSDQPNPIPIGTTDNVMDYTPHATEFFKSQWDKIHSSPAKAEIFAP